MNCHFVIEDFNLVSATALKRPGCQSIFGLAGEALLLLPFSYMTEDAIISRNSSLTEYPDVFFCDFVSDYFYHMVETFLESRTELVK